MLLHSVLSGDINNIKSYQSKAFCTWFSKKKKEVKHNLFVCSNIIFPQTLPTSYTLFYVKYFLFDK